MGRFLIWIENHSLLLASLQLLVPHDFKSQSASTATCEVVSLSMKRNMGQEKATVKCGEHVNCELIEDPFAKLAVFLHPVLLSKTSLPLLPPFLDSKMAPVVSPVVM